MNKKTKRVVGVGIFTAIVVVLQLLGSFIKFGTFSVSLVLIPIVVGAALYGIGAGAVYKLLEKKTIFGGALCAAVTAPVVNTGVFLLGCLMFFMPTINEWATAAGVESAGKFMIVGLVGLNFVFELAVNLVLSSVIVKLIKLGKKESE